MRIIILVIVPLAACLSVASGQEATSQPAEKSAEKRGLTDAEQIIVDKLVNACNDQRAELIEDQQAELAKLQKPQQSQGRGGQANSSNQEREKQLRAARLRLKELQDKRKPFLPALPLTTPEWRVGLVGVPQQLEWRIDQVIGDGELLVHFEYTVDPVYANVPVDIRRSKQYWLKGYPIKDAVTGQRLLMSDIVLHINETKTYPTAIGGTNTTFILEVVDPAVVRAFEATIKALPAKTKK